MVIDFHTHLFKDELAPKAIGILTAAAGIPNYTNGTRAGLLASMQHAGIDLSVCQHIATRAEQTQTINRWAIEMQSPQLISFGTIHPDFVDWEAEIDFLAAAGIKGIKFHPDYQNFTVDDTKMYSLYEKIFSKDLIVLFHAGVDLAFAPPHACLPKYLQDIARDFPQGNIVAAHMGGYRHWDDVEEYLIGKRIYLDTSYSFEELGNARMSRIIARHGAEHILFASDSPWKPQDGALEEIQSLQLSSKEIDDILGENAKKLLKL
ncbi:MAG: amidohydrolase family protein [Clostridia bacterium]